MREKEIIEKMQNAGKITEDEAKKLLKSLEQSYNGHQEEEKTRNNQQKEAEQKTVIKNDLKHSSKEKQQKSGGNLGDIVAGLLKNVFSFNNSSGPEFKFEEELQGEFTAEQIDIFVKNTNVSLTLKSWENNYFKIEANLVVSAPDREQAEAVKTQSYFIEKKEDSLHIETKEKIKKGNIIIFLPGQNKYNFNLKNVNGKIAMENLIAEENNLKTTNGSLQVKQVKAVKQDLKSTNGSIVFSGEGTNISAKTTNGSIKFKPTFEKNSEMNIKTVNGSIKVLLSDESNFFLDLQTVNGSLICDLANYEFIKKEKKRLKKHYILKREIATAKQGKNENINLSAKNVNGSIKISENRA